MVVWSVLVSKASKSARAAIIDGQALGPFYTCSHVEKNCLLRRLLGADGVGGPGAGQDAPSTLPRTVQAALKRAQIPADALSVFVAPAPPGKPRAWTGKLAAPRNPASVMKAGDHLCGPGPIRPAFVWRTPCTWIG